MISIFKTSVKMAALGAVVMGASAANAGVDFGKSICQLDLQRIFRSDFRAQLS